MIDRAGAAVFAAGLLLGSGAAAAQTVSMGGSLGDKALLVIDGVPHSVAVGSTVSGVHLVSLQGDGAVVEIGGKRLPISIGGARVKGGGNDSPNGEQIVLSAQSDGHFFAGGLINGKVVRFVVDTGATNVAMGEDEARRIGLDFAHGERGTSMTANGAVPVHQVVLDSIRIGDVTVRDVRATVFPAAMGHVLLGNSFLTRFQMKRENDTLTLVRRY